MAPPETLTSFEETPNTSPATGAEPDAQSYDQSHIDDHMEGQEELVSFQDFFNDMIGERTFDVGPQIPVDYYEEALASLQNGDQQFTASTPSSEELGIETEEGNMDRNESHDVDEGSNGVEEPIVFNIPGMYTFKFSSAFGLLILSQTICLRLTLVRPRMGRCLLNRQHTHGLQKL